MQSITAMAHLNACVLFMMDISEQCGHSIEEQIKLFQGLRPLFANKPVVIGLNKIDVITPENLSDENKNNLAELEKSGVFLVPLSTLTDVGVMNLKKEACDRLLSQRIENKIHSKRFEGILNRLHIAMPEKNEDINFINKLNQRKICEIPELLNNDKYKQVIEVSNVKIPEIINGKNIIDFVDANLEENLKKLLFEERLREDAGFYDVQKFNDEENALFYLNKQLQSEKKLFMMEHALKKNQRKPVVPKNTLLKVI